MTGPFPLMIMTEGVRRRLVRGPLAGAGGCGIRAGEGPAEPAKSAAPACERPYFPLPRARRGWKGPAPGASAGRACHAAACRSGRTLAREAVCGGADEPWRNVCAKACAAEIARGWPLCRSGRNGGSLRRRRERAAWPWPLHARKGEACSVRICRRERRCAGSAFFTLPASAKEGRAGANFARWPASRLLSAGGISGGMGRRPEVCAAGRRGVRMPGGFRDAREGLCSAGLRMPRGAAGRLFCVAGGNSAA